MDDRTNTTAIRSKWRRRLLRLGIALAMVAALAASAKPAFMWLLMREYYFAAPVAHYPPPRSRAEAMRQDLDYLARFPELDRSFSPQAREAFRRQLDALTKRADTLTLPAFAMAVSRLLALADNGHTNVRPPDRAALLNRVPLRFGWFAEGLFVVRAKPEQAALLGAHVLAVDDVPAERLLQRLKPYYGGTFEHLRADSAFMLESPDALHAIDAALPADRLQLEVARADGTRATVEVPALPPDPHSPDVWPERQLAPAPIAHAGAWRTVLADDDALPWVLRTPDHSLYWRRLDDGRAFYAHLWAIDGDDRGPLPPQLHAILDGLAPASLDYAIVDLRLDGGGNYLTAYAFARALPRYVKPDGHLYVLTDEHTFSAAIVTLAWLRHYGGGRTVIVGTHVGDREQFWAEGSRFVLPNSKLWMAFRTGYHDWEHGCHAPTRCFWPNVYFSVAAGKLGPDLVVPWRYADYARGRDTALEAVLRAAHGD
ncbi:MAG TPA: hypothetical protein VF216_12795 [Mizugakiibacter sp.]